jgi:hypothetical protein
MAGKRGRIAVILLVSAAVLWSWPGPWPVSAAGKQLVVSQAADAVTLDPHMHSA